MPHESSGETNCSALKDVRILGSDVSREAGRRRENASELLRVAALARGAVLGHDFIGEGGAFSREHRAVREAEDRRNGEGEHSWGADWDVLHI